jgi:hypothetical protein
VNPNDIGIDDLLESRLGFGDGSPDWARNLFKLAYCYTNGPFTLVPRHLSSLISVLAYVPGKCMAAAAGYAAETLGGAWKPHEFGRLQPGDSSVAAVWERGLAVVAELRNRKAAAESSYPFVIAYNLDMMCDAQGHVLQDPAVQLALHTLVEATRGGVVLGLADQDGPRLAALERHFADTVRLPEIAPKGFRNLIPQALGKVLGVTHNGGVVRAADIDRVHARLRYTDPVTAVRFMVEAATASTSLDAVIANLTVRTRPSEFEPTLEPVAAKVFRGYHEWTSEPIYSDIVLPYQNWLGGKAGADPQSLQPGMILFGPPGTGKTRLAREIAAHLGRPVRVVSASQIKAGVYGEAERNVHTLFRDIRRAAPCVAVFDDADDLFPRRDRVTGSVAGADIGIVNAMLSELEGVRGRLHGVLVILTTNRFHSLDPAVRERLSVHVRVPFPLDKVQVSQIVEATKEQYELELTEDIQKKLIELFLGPADGAASAPQNLDQRFRAESGLYSARRIERALMRLRTWAHPNAPTAEHVEQLKVWLDRESTGDPDAPPKARGVGDSRN